MELKPNEDANTVTLTYISVSHVEPEFVDTTFFDTFIHDNNIEIDRGIYMNTGCLYVRHH